MVSSAPPTSTDSSSSTPACRSRSLEADQLELVRLVRELGARLILGHDPAHEALALADDAVHGLLDRLQVFGREGLLDVEVVVEAVGDGRADAELRLGVDGLHGLRGHVRGRVAQDVEAVGRVDRDRLDGVGLGGRCREVLQFAVDAHGDDVAVGEQLESGLTHPTTLAGSLAVSVPRG